MSSINKEKILFVDDSATVRKTAVKILSERYEVIEALNGEDAWEKLRAEREIRIVFADIQMPILNGLQLLVRLKKSEDEYLTSLPVIMITGESDSEATMRAVFEMGATDFIGKPFKAMDLLTRAYSYLKLTSKVRKLNQLSGIDRQTGLYNATQFKKSGEQILSLATRSKTDMTVAYLEICDYQQIKLTQGDNITAQIITTIASRFTVMLRKEDVVARVGIARFALIFPCTSRIKASTIMKRICDTIHNLAFDTGTKKIYVKTATGIATGHESEHACFDEVSLIAECALMSASTRHDAATNDSGHEDDILAKTSGPENHRDTLLQSLLHMIEGDYSKISDTQLRHIHDSFNNFAAFIEKHRPVISNSTGT
jgi:diguanylate cyclase (GGDEF)-like protein